MLENLIAPLLTIAFGALAGGLTNSVAIWMLFHPYEPLRVRGRKIGLLQGAIPKNQPRLAAAVGRTVGNRLLTESDLERTFADEEFRRAFDRRLGEFVDVLLLEERGSIREMLPESILPEVESALHHSLDRVREQIAAWLDSEEFERAVADRAGSVVEALSDVPIGGALTPARSAALASALDGWMEGTLGSDGFYRAVDDYLSSAARSLLSPEKTFEQTIPPGMVAAFERGLSNYLPLAIARLGALLEDDRARARFERGIHDLLQRFLRDLRFHQRVVARLVITEDTVDRVLDTIREEGAEQIAHLLKDPAVQAAMSRGINDAVVDFLRRPVHLVLGEADSESVVAARRTLANWMASTARDPATRSFLVGKLEAALHEAGARSWGEVLERVPPASIAGGLVSLARSDAAAQLIDGTTRQLVDTVLDRPIGVPARWLPDGAADRLKEGLSAPVWEWLQAQVPAVVRQIDVARRVEEKVLAFPAARMEQIVRRVTERELKLIVRLGYVLGGIIGTVLVLVTRLVG